MNVLLAVAGAVLVVLAFAAYLVGLCFKSRKVRKGIMIGTVAVYVLVATCYLGFIAFVLSGDLNRN
jgi:hypothetical protein